MSEHIIDFLTLSGAHTRSIALDRDLDDDSVVDGYLVTPNAIAAIKHVADNLARETAQRAWKIVGPYGSGKSALGVMLAQLMAGPKRHAPAAQALAATAPQVAGLLATSNRLPLAVVGSRVSFGVALATAIATASKGWKKGSRLSNLIGQIDLDRQTYAKQPLNLAIGQILDDFTNAARASGYLGVALFIDEVGKFIEYAALYPEHGDLIALQQIAEKANTPHDDGLIVLAMLHQHFASYAAGVGRSLSDEWHKVAARFEEIPFDEPVERYVHFASHAMRGKPALASLPGLTSEAHHLYGQALAMGILRAPSTADQRLIQQPISFYPLHPLSIACLATISKRFGQSERSFHAFLKSNEPLGLRDFAERTPASVGYWYRLPELYDYLAEGYSLRFRDLAAERRWVFAKNAIDSVSRENLATRILKAIAVLELSAAGTNSSITADLIAFATGENDLDTVRAALEGLARDGVLIRRRKKAEYGFAISDAVNVEALFEASAQANEDDLIVEGVSATVSQRPVVANRHYDRTGTIRTLGIKVGSIKSFSGNTNSAADESSPDAWLRLIIFNTGSEDELKARERLFADHDQFGLAALVPLSPESRAAVAELAIWQRVLRQLASQRLDPWANRYVEGRIQDAREVVGRLVASSLVPSGERPGPTYWYCGQAVPDSEQMNPSQIASWLFDSLYPKSPVIINELINKDRPAPAIVLARQRIFDVILDGDHTRGICGDSEFPPERLIHLTLLRKTGIWQEQGGRWHLEPPSDTCHPDQADISGVWDAIGEAMRSEEPVSFEDVILSLAAPPLGVRAGPATIWIVLYLLVNKERCAVFDRGTLVLELSSEHLQRMFRNPRTFAMRELAGAERNRRLLTDYRGVLDSIGCALDGETTYLEIARSLYKWFERLSDFTKQTTTISKDANLVRSILVKARDPIGLLMDDLPRGHLQSKSKLGFGHWLREALSDLGMAHRRLQNEATVELSRGFGIPGTLGQIRAQLQAECTTSASGLADAELKSFILRCTDLSLSDEKWLDSIGSLVVRSALDGWTDDTVTKFKQALTDLCAHYRRWMQLVMQRKKAPVAAGRFVGLTITQAGGQESSLFVSTSDESKELAKEVLAVLTRPNNGNRDLAASALAQALLQLDTSFISSAQETRTTRGHRKAR